MYNRQCQCGFPITNCNRDKYDYGYGCVLKTDIQHIVKKPTVLIEEDTQQVRN